MRRSCSTRSRSIPIGGVDGLHLDRCRPPRLLHVFRAKGGAGSAAGDRSRGSRRRAGLYRRGRCARRARGDNARMVRFGACQSARRRAARHPHPRSATSPQSRRGARPDQIRSRLFRQDQACRLRPKNRHPHAHHDRPPCRLCAGGDLLGARRRFHRALLERRNEARPAVRPDHRPATPLSAGRPRRRSAGRPHEARR